MVVARASGMDLASILKRNTFLTLAVRPAGGPGSARDGGTEGAPGRGDTGGPGTAGHGGSPRLFMGGGPTPPGCPGGPAAYVALRGIADSIAGVPGEIRVFSHGGILGCGEFREGVLSGFGGCGGELL